MRSAEHFQFPVEPIARTVNLTVIVGDPELAISPASRTYSSSSGFEQVSRHSYLL